MTAGLAAGASAARGACLVATARRRSGLKTFVAALLALVVAALPAEAGAVRVKELGGWSGVRTNKLVGYGLVVGLAGTGDTERVFSTVKSLASMLRDLSVPVDPAQLRVKNVAAVMVTAVLPPFARHGTDIDVNVASLGNAKSLAGGTLLFTPLRAADGQFYAVAQGELLINGFGAEANGASVQKNHLTAGRIPNGATVEREVTVDLSKMETLRFQLHMNDFATAVAVGAAMRKKLGVGEDEVQVLDGVTVEVAVPADRKKGIPQLIAELEALDVERDAVAQVVINSRDGTVVVSGGVCVSKVAVAHGSLKVEIRTAAEASQPNALAQGETVVVEQSQVSVDEEKVPLRIVEGCLPAGELVDALNALGATTRDLMSIFQAIKQAGALSGALVVI